MILPLPMVHKVSSIRCDSSGVLKIKPNQPKDIEMSSEMYPRIGNQLSKIYSGNQSNLRE
jgi:hypothetical protein